MQGSLRMLAATALCAVAVPAGTAFAQADSSRTTFLLSRAFDGGLPNGVSRNAGRLARPAHRPRHRLRVRRDEHRPERHQRPHRRLRRPPRAAPGPQRHALADRRPPTSYRTASAASPPTAAPTARSSTATRTTPELRGVRLGRLEPRARRHQRQARRLRLQPASSSGSSASPWTLTAASRTARPTRSPWTATASAWPSSRTPPTSP